MPSETAWCLTLFLARRASPPSRARTYRLLVLLAFLLGLGLRLSWVEQRLAEPPREKYWHVKVQFEQKLRTLRWGSDEYLVYVSAAVNAGIDGWPGQRRALLRRGEL